MLFGPQLVATRDYTTSYTERYESPLYAVGLAMMQVLVAMFGFSLARFGRHRLRNAALVAALLHRDGASTPTRRRRSCSPASSVLGWLMSRVRKPSAVLIGIAVLVMPVVLGVSAFAFSSFRGGGGLELAGRTGYLTNIEPAGPFVSIIDEMTERGSSAPTPVSASRSSTG